MAKFYLYARRSPTTPDEAVLRLLCLTEPERAENPLELREDFKEVLRTDFVEIFDKNEVVLKFSGNLERVVQADSDDEDGARLRFRPFLENRLPCAVRRKNEKNSYFKGKVALYQASGVDKMLFESKVDLTKVMAATS
jgi:hypothetical protein